MLEANIYVKPMDVKTQLHKLGLKQEQLVAGLRHGNAEAALCTKNDPMVLRNFVRWGKTFRGLADALEGWSHQERRCLPVMINASETVAITVSSGNSDTGNPSGQHPRSRNPKGPLTREVVGSNQSVLPGMENVVTKLRPEQDGLVTWILLYHVDRTTGDIYAELSTPVAIDKHGCVSEWFDRIILEPIQGSSPVTSSTEEDEEEIDFSVDRRQSN